MILENDLPYKEYNISFQCNNCHKEISTFLELISKDRENGDYYMQDIICPHCEHHVIIHTFVDTMPKYPKE